MAFGGSPDLSTVTAKTANLDTDGKLDGTQIQSGTTIPEANLSTRVKISTGMDNTSETEDYIYERHNNYSGSDTVVRTYKIFPGGGKTYLYVDSVQGYLFYKKPDAGTGSHFIIIDGEQVYSKTGYNTGANFLKDTIPTQTGSRPNANKKEIDIGIKAYRSTSTNTSLRDFVFKVVKSSYD